MKILLLVGFFILSFALGFFVVHNISAQVESCEGLSFGEMGRCAQEKMGSEFNRLTEEFANLMIEGELTDEEIDKELSKTDSVFQEKVVKKLKEMGSGYNGQYITSYNEYLQEEQEKEEAKKNDPFYINEERQETKMRDLDNRLNLNGSELYALENLVSLDELLTIETRVDLSQIFKDRNIDFNVNSYQYDQYANINNYDEYKDYTGIN